MAKKDLAQALVAGLLLTAWLSLLFLPTLDTLATLSQIPLGPMGVLLAAILYRVLPQVAPPCSSDWGFAITICLLPLGVALTRGLGNPAPSPPTSWTILWSPLLEEILFRGLFWNCIASRWPSAGSWTNPLPLPLLLSSGGFALWHLQNLEQLGTFATLLQVVGTFGVGIWFGALRWTTGGLLLPCLAHILANWLSGGSYLPHPSATIEL